MEAILTELQERDRCAIRAACGMGKTVIAQEVIRQHFESGEVENGVYIVVTSGIQLTRQCRGDFAHDGVVGGHQAFSVHDGSEDLSTHKQGDREQDVAALASFLMEPSDQPRIIFTTYNSVDKVIEAQHRVGQEGEADLVVFDEAHRLGGMYDPKARTLIKGNENESDEGALTMNGRVPRIFDNAIPNTLQAQSRVFLSATPIVPDESERYKPRVKVDLAKVAASEDAGKPQRVSINHLDEHLFGRFVSSWGLKDAVDLDALVPLHPVLAPVSIRVNGTLTTLHEDDLRMAPSPSGEWVAEGEEGMAVNAYATTVSALESLASGEGHHVLAFSRRIEHAEDIQRNWREVALSLAQEGGSPLTEGAAKGVLASPSSTPSQLRAARLTLLATHATVVSASSKSNEGERKRAFGLYEDATLGCSCGSPGGWCACARVVSNVDLFGQGINVKSIDTVVLGSLDKTGDVQLTQAAGRAMRLCQGKRTGRVVVPSVTGHDTTDRSRPLARALTLRSLYGLSRLYRDSTGAALRQERMSTAEELMVTTLGGGTQPLDTVIRSVAGDPLRAAVLVKSWEATKRGARDAEIQVTGDKQGWSKLSEREQYARTLAHAAAYSSDDRAFRIIAQSRPAPVDIESAERSVGLLESRARAHDRDSLTKEERRVCQALGILDKNGIPKVAGTAGHYPIKSLEDTCGKKIVDAAIEMLANS